VSFSFPLLSSKKRESVQQDALHVFIDYFNSMEQDEDFPLRLALSALNDLENTAEDEEELLFFILEDIIFTSLYATFYEELFMALRNNPQLTIPLIEEFSKTSDDRDQKIAMQTEDHLNFVQNGGDCEGCSSCENHRDVLELIAPWERADFSFFIPLYLGMQTIQYAFEQFVYDFLPENSSILKHADRDTIQQLRKYLFEYAEQNVEL
jgi:hypothetical protein